MTYDTWKQTDTIGEKLHADDDAVEAMRRDAAEALASEVLGDPASVAEAFESGFLRITDVAKVVTTARDWMPSDVRARALRAAQDDLFRALTDHFTATLTDDEIRAYIRDERERARKDTDE